MPTTAQGIWYPGPGDPINPLENVFSTLAASVESNVIRRIPGALAGTPAAAGVPDQAIVWDKTAQQFGVNDGGTWRVFIDTDSMVAPDRPVSLGATTNLNDLVQPGWYYQNSNSNASTARNYPYAIAGVLELFTWANTSNAVVQRYTSYNNLDIWTRTNNLGTWSSWVALRGYYEPRVNISVVSGFTGHDSPQAVKRNGIVYLSHGFGPDGITTTLQKVGSIPDGYRPSTYLYVPAVSYDPNSVGRFKIDANGDVSLRSNGTTAPYYHFDGVSYPA